MNILYINNPTQYLNLTTLLTINNELIKCLLSQKVIINCVLIAWTGP